MNDVQVSSAERDISHVHGSVPASLGSMRTLRRNEFITPRSPSRVTGANALAGGIRFAHFSTSTSAVCRQHPVAGRRDGVPPPRGGHRTTLEAPARRRDGHPQDLDSLFAASAGPKWTIGLCAGSALIAALSLQPTFARFPATARKQGRPFDRLGQRKSPSLESHPVPSGTGSSNPVPSSGESGTNSSSTLHHSRGRLH